MTYISNYLTKRSRAFYILCVVMSIVVLYTLINFLYLKIAGVYGVAAIREVVGTSEGVDIKYEFNYADDKYSGVFTDIKKYRTGDKYFVLFLKNDPTNNTLLYNDPVPNCLRDSINSFWSTCPKCLNESSSTNLPP